MADLPSHPTLVGWRVAARDEMICASKIATKPRERGCSVVLGKTRTVVVTLMLGMLVFGGALTAAAQSVHEVTMLIEEVDDALPDSAVLLLDHRHRVLFRTEGVQVILRDIVASTRPDMTCSVKAGGAWPWVVHAASARLWAAIENGYKTNNPTVVGKGCSQWWTVTATVPEAGMSEEVATVLIISRSHPRDTAPVLLAAYGLTEREQDVINLIRLGMSTEAIARRLFVSRYTVQDHLKNIFAKVGVRTRGELMAVIFREESPVGRPVAQGERGVVERATDGTRQRNFSVTFP